MKLLSKIMLSVAALFTVAAPLTAAQAVRIEGAVNVANFTAGDTQYQKSVNAKFDDVVKVELWYHNMENADSNLVANNLKVKIDLPTQAGKAQVVTAHVAGDNTNSITDTATVNLNTDQATLQYIPGTAMWKHNTGTNDQPNWVTEKVSDNIVTGPTGLVLENEKPCFNFAATVTIMARVTQPAVTITKQVHVLHDGKAWATENTAKAGDTLEYMITFKNAGNTTLQNVIVGDNLPGHTHYVPGTTTLTNQANPNGLKLTNDNIANGGVNVGNYTPGAVGYVTFQVKIDDQLQCGDYKLTNVGLVRPQGMNEFQNIAITNVNVVCAQTPPTTPTPPAQSLPQTGAEGAAAGAMGTGILGYAAQAYRKSKRSLVDALKSVNKR